MSGSGLGAGASRLVSAARTQQRMSETHAVLWTVVIVATVADVVLTLTGLSIGLGEGNPVVRLLLSGFGPAGLWLVKFLAMLWLVAGWVLLPERVGTAFLAVFALVTVAVTAHNAVLILEVGTAAVA